MTITGTRANHRARSGSRPRRTRPRSADHRDRPGLRDLRSAAVGDEGEHLHDRRDDHTGFRFRLLLYRFRDRALCAEDSRPQSFTRPGHVIPVLVPDPPTGTERTSRIARAGRLVQSLICPTAPESHGADGASAVAFSSLVSLRDECEIACADEATDFGLPILHYAALTSRTSRHVPAQSFSHHQENSFDDHHSTGSSRRVS